MAQRGYGYQQSGGYGAPPPSYGAQSAYGSYGGAATSSVPSYSQPPPSYSQPAPSYSQQPRQQQPGYQQVNRGAPAPSYQSYGGGYAQNPGPSHVSASSGGGSSHGSGSLGDIQYLQVRPSFSAPDRLPEVQEMTRHALERADNNEEEIEKIASGSRILSQASKEKRKLEEGISKSQRVVEELSEKKRQLEAELMKLDNDSIEVRSSVEQKSRLQDEAKKEILSRSATGEIERGFERGKVDS
uniref:Uncharacterized protein n=1 Tax=Palpitomonas bilix TaxID=652834 RepID=A0A7S3DL24_9EUKA|mmetsp:Transcript_4067/g.7903  ORF Transcript_4067/g.7903 Transcript_4067/m.7903 type:complete len:242 (+) Transcript_4067:138-863(+)